MHRPSLDNVVRVLILATFCALIAVAGWRARGDAALGAEERVVRPPERQMLAYATSDALWVMDGKKHRRLLDLPPDEELSPLVWSGDGQQIAVLSGDSPISLDRLTMVDVTTGRKRTWDEVYGGLAPSPTGVTSGGSDTFSEFTPNGRRVGHRVAVAPRRKSRNYQRPDDMYTTVAFAMPFMDRWLVAAESSTRGGAHGSPHRLFLQDPVTGAMTLVGGDRSTYGVGDVERVDDRHVLWVGTSSGGACDPYNHIRSFGGRTPDLPQMARGSWEIRRLAAGPGGIEAIARRVHLGWTEDGECVPDERTYQRMSLNDGAWRRTADDVVDLDKAANGRVAIVRASSARMRENLELPDLRYDGAEVISADGQVTRLPADTRAVSFSPSVPVRMRAVRVGEQRLTSRDRLTEAGIGPLRFGDDPGELQRAVAAQLRFTLDAQGCGSVFLADTSLEDELGVRGQLVGHQLDWLEVTSRDTPVGYGDPLSSLQPDISAIAPRGPATSKGVRAGEPIDKLLEAHGTPEAVRQLGGESVEYRFAEGSATLLARVDGAGAVRRLELRRHRERSRCGR